MVDLIRIQEVYESVIAKPSQEREAFLEAICEGDKTLQAEVLSLLEIDTEDCSLLNAYSLDNGSLEGVTLGPYTILKELGRGGMGHVYLARQKRPIERLVAIKFVTHWRIGEERRKRFELEQQVMAQMNHTYIAKLHACDITEDGQPFFVMEYLEGESIDSYCNRQNLNLEQRVDVFIKVCEAINHAHLKGVIHRDIKPSNIVIVEEGGLPIPKIIDFGIARSLAENTDLTGLGQTPGSYAYMSPEQAGARNEDGHALEQDFRSDVYGLGALLYQLLVGRPPLVWPEHLPGDLIRADICKRLPLNPKEAWLEQGRDQRQKQAEDWGMKTTQISKPLGGDLGRIIMTALEKDPAHRYQSVNVLADELRRYRAHLPVMARTPSLGYALEKFCSRHRKKLGMAVLATFLFASILGFVVAQRKAVSEERARSEAQRINAQNRVTTVVTFLKEILQKSNPYGAEFQTLSTREILQQAYEKIRSEHLGDVHMQRQLMIAISEVYESCGLYQDGITLLESALVQTSRDGPAIHEQVSILLKMASLHDKNENYEMAEDLSRRAFNLNLSDESSNHALRIQVLNTLSNALLGTDQYAEAEARLKQALSLIADLEDKSPLIETHTLLGSLHMHQSHYQVALQNYEVALRLAQDLPGEHRQRDRLTVYIANYHMDQGNYDQAKSLFLSLIDEYRQTYQKHPDLAEFLKQLGMLYLRQGKYADAEKTMKEALAMEEELFGRLHPSFASTLSYLGNLYIQVDRSDEAEPLLQEAVTICRTTLGNVHSQTSDMLHQLGLHYAVMGDARSESCFQETLSIRRQLHGSYSQGVAYTVLAEAYRLAKLDRDKEAELLYEEALVIGHKLFGSHHDFVASVMHHLSQLYVKSGRYTEAESLLHHSITIFRDRLGNDNGRLAASLMRLARILVREGMYAEAEEKSYESSCIYREVYDPSHWRVAMAEQVLGKALHMQKRLAEAEPLLLDSYQRFKKAKRTQSSRETREYIIQLYNDWGKPEQQQKWRQTAS